MTNIQFNHQENQTNFIPLEKEVAKAQPMAPPPRSFRFVPIAILASFVFIGGVIFYKVQIAQKEQALVTNYPDLEKNSSQEDNQNIHNIVRETPIQPQDQIAINPENQAIRATADVGENVEHLPPATPATIINEATPQPTSLNRNVVKNSPVIAKNKEDILVVPQTKTQATPTPRPQTIRSIKPVITISASTNTQSNSHTTTTKTTYHNDDRYKPSTPYLETCGKFENGKWHNTKIVLPKFDKNDETATEYWAQVGKNHNHNDTLDQHYQQTDRVVFELESDNNQEYFVRFAIKIGQGDFQKWSNTLRFKCEHN